MSNKFRDLVLRRIRDSIENNYEDNYDEKRFGELSLKDTALNKLKSRALSKLLTRNEANSYLEKAITVFTDYNDQLEMLYGILADEESKALLVDLIAFKILGHRRVKLPTNNPQYFKYKIKEQELFDKSTKIHIQFLGKNKELYYCDLNEIGIPLKLYAKSTMYQFMLEQYRYKDMIKAERGDCVFDCGACYGDTSLYFANLIGAEGKVLAFEFIPGNLGALKKNLALNEELAGNIDLVENPLWGEVGKDVFFKDMGPGSVVQFEDFEGSEGKTSTQTIDNIREDKGLNQVDFIKMDIEGAEPFALQGAERTIRRDLPKLAIASYHSMDDFVNIPLWINDLNLGYQIYLAHTTLHWEESVIFARAQRRSLFGSDLSD